MLQNTAFAEGSKVSTLLLSHSAAEKSFFTKQVTECTVTLTSASLPGLFLQVLFPSGPILQPDRPLLDSCLGSGHSYCVLQRLSR